MDEQKNKTTALQCFHNAMNFCLTVNDVSLTCTTKSIHLQGLVGRLERLLPVADVQALLDMAYRLVASLHWLAVVSNGKKNRFEMQCDEITCG